MEAPVLVLDWVWYHLLWRCSVPREAILSPGEAVWWSWSWLGWRSGEHMEWHPECGWLLGGAVASVSGFFTGEGWLWWRKMESRCSRALRGARLQRPDRGTPVWLLLSTIPDTGPAVAVSESPDSSQPTWSHSIFGSFYAEWFNPETKLKKIEWNFLFFSFIGA